MLLRPALKPELLRRVESLDLLLSPEVSPEGAGHRIRLVKDEGDSPPTGTTFVFVRARTNRFVIFEMPSMVPARGSFLTWLGLGLGSRLGSGSGFGLGFGFGLGHRGGSPLPVQAAGSRVGERSEVQVGEDGVGDVVRPLCGA